MIIIVEDSAFQRILLQKTLLKWGPKGFSTFEDFLKFMEAQSPDQRKQIRAIVLDWFIGAESAYEYGLLARKLGVEAEIILYTDADVSSDVLKRLVPCTALPKKISRLVQHIERWKGTIS